MSLRTTIDEHPLVVLALVSVSAGALAWGVCYALTVQPRDFEIAVLQRSVRRVDELQTENERLREQIEKAGQLAFFDRGWDALFKRNINREPGEEIVIGPCPGAQCYAFRFGDEFFQSGRRFKRIQLGGGGFLRKPKGIDFAFNCQFAGPMEVTSGTFVDLELTRGGRYPLVCDDHDFLIVTLDVDPLTVAIARYTGTRRSHEMGHRRFSPGFNPIEGD
jgi:hypothetical protein